VKELFVQGLFPTEIVLFPCLGASDPLEIAGLISIQWSAEIRRRDSLRQVKPWAERGVDAGRKKDPASWGLVLPFAERKLKSKRGRRF